MSGVGPLEVNRGESIIRVKTDDGEYVMTYNVKGYEYVSLHYVYNKEDERGYSVGEHSLSHINW